MDLSKIKLKDSAVDLYSQGSNFVEQYGDSFVYGLVTGGDFLGILEIESSSAQEFKDKKASLSGKINSGLYKASASVDFQQTLNSITSEYQMKATIMRQGDIGVLSSEISPSQIIQDALAFPQKVQDANAYPYESIILPYSYIEHPVASPLDVESQAESLRQLGVLRQKNLSYQRDLTYALDHQDQFPDIDVVKVSNRYNETKDEIERMVETASNWFKNYNKCKKPNVNLALLGNILPPQQKGENSMNLKIATHRLFVGQPSEPNSLGAQQEFRFKPSDDGTVPRLCLKGSDGNDLTFGKRVIGTWFTLYSHSEKFTGINYAGSEITDTNKVSFYSNAVQAGFIVEVCVLYED